MDKEFAIKNLEEFIEKITIIIKAGERLKFTDIEKQLEILRGCVKSAEDSIKILKEGIQKD